MHQSTNSDVDHAGGEMDPHGHDPYLAHHFETSRQQFDAGKLGMWLFLITEVLFFGGLFVAYAVYRSNHPEVFIDAHKYLDKVLGGFNTIVLLFSSLTMAWGVRCAQLGQRRGLVWCLTLTLVCASLFLGVKAVEYAHKWDLGLYWGAAFAPLAVDAPHGEAAHGPWLWYLSIPAALAALGCGVLAFISRMRRRHQAATVAFCLTLTALAFFVGIGAGKGVPAITGALFSPGDSPAHAAVHQPLDVPPPPAEQLVIRDPDAMPGVSLLPIFFSIYYLMTGIHAVHILAGMGVIAWILARATRGEFNAQYFSPVDFTGLYWHLVDLIWIYLFPLLYLIH
jgi:cytochrome c oxidase subunit 3